MKHMLRMILQAVLLVPVIGYTQGDNYVLFSKTGDKLLTRTSCVCKTKDTLTTYFNVLKNVNGNLQLVSVFPVKEPGKSGIPCADFSLVAADTISKYELYYPGRVGIRPRRFKIKSKVLTFDTTTTNKGELVYYRYVKHTFKIGRKAFYTSSVWTTAATKKEKISKPEIKQVFGSPELKKFHFVVVIESVFISPKTGKLMRQYAHTRIMN